MKRDFVAPMRKTRSPLGVSKLDKQTGNPMTIVNEIMKTTVITIGMDETLEQIQKRFEKHKFHHLLVLENDELIGIISDRDVLKEISPHVNTLSEDARALKTLKTKAHQLMTRKPITVESNTLMEDAGRIMLEQIISCLPVVSASGNIEGILSMKDILNFYIEKDSQLKNLAINPEESSTE
jgi:acetoin utilization protein AcuB